VKVGLNAPADFEMPDNLALDREGNLYIAEDPGGNFPAKTRGDDIWVARPSAGQPHEAAGSVVRFATINDCDAEPTGIYFETTGHRLFEHPAPRGRRPGQGHGHITRVERMRLEGRSTPGVGRAFVIRRALPGRA
jgi:uncharacterized protein